MKKSVQDLSPNVKQLLKFYHENYEFLVHRELTLDATEKIFLGESKSRSCRYCGATDDGRFKKVAHALPEAIGNKCLISLDECDECNDFFGRTMDEHLANYLGIHRTVQQIRGKSGVPKYGVPGKNPRLWREGPNQFLATAQFDDDFLEIDASGQKGTIKGFKQPYRPKAVFKCLVKMAIAVMPPDEIPNFEGTLAWLRREERLDQTNSRSVFCFTSISQMTRNGIDVTLMRRRNPVAKLPYISFFIAFSKLTFQIFLPFCKADEHFVGESVQIHRFPNRAEMIGTVSYGQLDLSSNELVRDQPDDIHFEIGPPGIIIQKMSGSDE